MIEFKLTVPTDVGKRTLTCWAPKEDSPLVVADGASCMPPLYGPRYRITHRASGFAIIKTIYKHKALKAVKRLLASGIADWRKSADELQRTLTFEQVQKVAGF